MPNLTTKKRIIKRAARRHKIRPAILYGLWGAESNFGQNTGPSSAGAVGDFQFMPPTARAYGIDPHNFKQAADAAAKYLSTYKDRGTAGMLAAYNAGPAGNPNNPETQAYIPKVLQIAKTWDGGGRGSKPQGDRSAQATAARNRYETVPGVDNTALRQSLMQQYLSERGKPGALLALKGGLDEAQDTPARRVRVGTERVRRGGQQQRQSARQRADGVGGELKELFWNGPGAVNVKDGRRVPKGFVSGHTDHVHVAGGRRSVVTLGKLAQQMGLRVSENPAFDPVDPVHTEGSYHYSDRAIDVSGDPRLMRKFARRVARIYNA